MISLDEPTASLDLHNQVRVLRVLRELARQGRAVLLTTHVPDYALWLGALALALQAGGVLAYGTAAEVCSAQTLGALYGVRLRAVGEEGSLRPCIPSLDV